MVPLFCLKINSSIYTAGVFGISWFRNSPPMRASITLNSSAHQNPSTLNPGTICAASKIMSALTTKVNSPSVRIFNGKVINNTRGRISALISPRTMAITRAVKKLLTVTPGRIYAATKITIADMSQLRSMFIIFLVLGVCLPLLWWLQGLPLRVI